LDNTEIILRTWLILLAGLIFALAASIATGIWQILGAATFGAHCSLGVLLLVFWPRNKTVSPQPSP